MGRQKAVIKARREARRVLRSDSRSYLHAIETKQLIFATGEAGCGKTWISAAKAAEALIHKDIDRIIVTRPVLQADEDLGFLPGDISEKFAPYFRPVYDVLVKRLGASFMQYCLRPEIGKVEIAPFAYMRGGDITQCDLPAGVPSGLADALARFEEDEMVGIVRFGKDDCVRSALCQRTLHAYG
ncbi:MAG: PhoH family protein [Pantoea sp.]|nr:PhoH family protein [Pantoea sp.]